MTLRPGEVAPLVAEIAPRIEGTRLTRCLGGEAGEILLEFESGHVVLLSTHPDLSRIHLSRIPRRPSPSPFAARLERRLAGALVQRASCAPLDRAVRFEFEGCSLVAELFGRASNLILVDAAGTVLEVLRAVRRGRRPLIPGQPYPPSPPAPPAAPAPSRFRAEASARGETPLNAVVEAHYRAEVSRVLLDEERRDLFARILARLRNRRDRAAGLDRRLAETEKAEALRRQGELLKGHLGRLRRGMTEIEVEDFFDPATPRVRIPLEPTLDGPGNLERLFRRYRKLLDGIEPTRKERVRIDLEIARLESDRARVEEAAAFEEVRAITAALEAEKLLRPPPAARPPGKERPKEGPRVRRFVSADGLEILVGGSAEENDHLTLRVARGSDLWLHAREAAGAHVVVRVPRGKSVPLETLLDAASLAAHFSRLREASKVDVLYTQAKFVRKPRKAPAGLVLVAGEKTIRVAPDPVRLERLLRPLPARIDPDTPDR